MDDVADDEMQRGLPDDVRRRPNNDDDRARVASCCLAARNDDDSDVRRAVMRGGGQAVMRGRVQWRWEAPGGGGTRGARGAGASYLGAIDGA